jgi:hypothetical protein
MPRPDRPDRRAFIGQATMAMASARLGTLGISVEQPGVSRELTALTTQSSWLNSPPLGAGDVRGKVVLVDFCTYSCINWLRTLPSLRAWWERYQGTLVMVGVHTPEFGFEHDVANVSRALRQLNVKYPVVLDNDYRIWRAFRNNYWPALYFIDARGRVRDRQFGEGHYERWEPLIERMIVAAGGEPPPPRPVASGGGIEATADWNNLRSPEAYVGSDRMQHFTSPGGASRDRRRAYAMPKGLRLNEWALENEWTIGGQSAVLESASGRIAIAFHARDVHLVMAPAAAGVPVRFRVTLDGRPPGPAHGGDIDASGTGVVVEPRLYQLIRQPAPNNERVCEIEFTDRGAVVYAFTFG